MGGRQRINSVLLVGHRSISSVGACHASVVNMHLTNRLRRSLHSLGRFAAMLLRAPYLER